MLVAAGASTMVADIAHAEAASRPKVVLGQVNLSFYAVTGAVIQELLERTDHTVEVRTGPHDQMFPLLDAGEIDLMAAAWLPEGHATYWARYGQDAEEVAQLYDGARFFWAVPDYVPASAVSSIADLAKPEVALRMTKRIQGIGPAATISAMSEKAVADYDLAALGYGFQPGTAADWIAAHNAALAERRWFVFPTWAPQYLNRDGRLRPLEDPKGVLGGLNRAVLAAPRGRLDKVSPRARAVLSGVTIGLDGVTEMDRLVNVDGATPRQAALAWMSANSRRVEAWLRA